MKAFKKKKKKNCVQEYMRCFARFGTNLKSVKKYPSSSASASALY